MLPFPTGEPAPDDYEGYGPDDFEQERQWQLLEPLPDEAPPMSWADHYFYNRYAYDLPA